MMREENAKLWLFTMRDSLSHADFTKVIVTLWAIWHAHRKAMYEQIFQSPLSTHLFVKHFISELDVTAKAKPDKKGRVQQGPRHQSWIKLPTGFIKLNVDGAVSKQGNRGSVAAVCRDDRDHYLGSSSVTYVSIVDAPTLEALACGEALALADDLITTGILVSSDCQSVIKDIAKNSGGQHVAIIREIKTHA